MDEVALRERAGSLPTAPGVYVFRTADADETTPQSDGFDPDVAIGAAHADGRVLYVGKAVDLRDRVRSYTDPRSERIANMVDRAATVEVAVTETETQALLLEANLIKRYAPRYNVRLTDDKSYPLIQFTDHAVPRIEITRDPEEGATVYGPYTDRGRLETVLKAIRDRFGLRGCSDHKYANRDRPCIDYEMGICSAPCTGEITETAYTADVERAKRFFEGDTSVLADPLRAAMEAAAETQAFERASTLRDRLETVEEFHGTAADAVRDRGDDRAIDVLGVTVETDTATVARLHSEDGKLIDRSRHSVVVPAGEQQTPRVLAAFIQQYYAERTLPDAILVPEPLADDRIDAWLASEGVDLRVPGAGRDARLVELAMKNARTGTDQIDGQARTLAKRLGLDTDAVHRIEAFDVSHSDGTAVVGSNVVVVDGTPERSAYRRKRLTDENDDYANMRRLLEWRAQRAVEGRDDRPAPDLLLIDGGVGQLQAARDALEHVGWELPAIGLAKGDDGDRVVDTDGSIEVPDAARSVLGQARDEAHRFAVQYHETLRDDVSTPLDAVEGIGPARRDRLLRRFGSVAGIREASREELQRVEGIGAATADRLARSL